MKKNYIMQMPIPTCLVGVDGNVIKANPLIKNVFVYEDIVGTNFFALTGVKRDMLLTANSEEIIIERNKRIFKLWTNENPQFSSMKLLPVNHSGASLSGTVRS